MSPSSPPKLIRPAQSTSISFDQALSDKLHSSLVLRPTAPQKACNAPSRLKSHNTAKSNKPTPTTTSSGFKSQIASLLSTKDSESVDQTTSTTNDPIIVQGTRDKKRILDDYQKKYGKDCDDSIVVRKKKKVRPLIISLSIVLE